MSRTTRRNGFIFVAAMVLGMVAGLMAQEPAVPTEPAPVAVVSASQRAWPKPIPPPKGMEKMPGPWNDPAETTVWPNQTSCANSDPWLAANHDRIRSMRPRLLLINFSNEHSRGQLNAITKQLIQALAEASRYHGYANPKALAFLNYKVFKFIDLSDGKRGDSRLVPIKDPKAKEGHNMKYSQFFSEEFAKHYGITDPCDPGRNLRLDELIDGGYVHEIWFFVSGVVPETPHIGAFEVVEEKPLYDEDFQKKGNGFVQSGNGGDGDQPWTGRSVRIGCVNASRGIGCFIESLSHGMEGCAKSGAIPYLTKYFCEYAGFNLKERFNLPIESFYEVSYGQQSIRYPDKKTMIITVGGDKYQVTNYVCTGGNVHFTPNSRGHYDLDNTEAVLSTIENWRTASGKNGQNLPKRFTNAAFRKYTKLAPDGMGPWLIYWRQNMPGLDNKQFDDSGKPMKNWCPFLFY